jgi:copper chaperone CopZ
MTKFTLQVSGMHCPSCNMLVEDIVGDEKGVSSVKADFQKGTVEVDCDERVISLEKVKELIEKEAGYNVNG